MGDEPLAKKSVSVEEALQLLKFSPLIVVVTSGFNFVWLELLNAAL
jgi:hypothetical protein